MVLADIDLNSTEKRLFSVNLVPEILEELIPMTADADPSVHRHALRRRLERARIASGAGHGQAAAELGWTQVDYLLVAAVEDGFDDGRLADLGARYDIAPEVLAQVPAPPESPLSKAVRVLVAYERPSTVVRTFEPFLVPGLLQTPAYAESVLRFYSPPDGVAALVEARLARHDLFEDPDGPETVFLIDQSALHRWAGAEGAGPAVMREQLQHLREMARRPRVGIRVIPYAAGVHEGHKGPFVILGTADPVLYLEDAKGDVITIDPALVRIHRERFEDLLGLAAAPDELDAFLDRALEDLG
jgi:hypothetical protein